MTDFAITDFAMTTDEADEKGLTEPRRRRVAVLMGGVSSERPISLSTGNMILQALDASKYDAWAIDLPDVLRLADAPVRPDVVFIALHGKGGEDGTVQGMLELLGIPYTGSGVLASALAMDKRMAKRLFRADGIPVVPDVEVEARDLSAEPGFPLHLARQVGERLGFPVFVKPNAEGSTFGGTRAANAEALLPAVKHALCYDAFVLIETYLAGMEITVGVVEDRTDPDKNRDDWFARVLPVVEIVPKAAFYDYESKYAAGGSEHVIPARLSDGLLRQAQELALRCHRLLGCRGMSRTDIIVADGALFVLEVNTIPGMTPTSLLPQAAAHDGLEFPALLDRLIERALSPDGAGS